MSQYLKVPNKQLPLFECYDEEELDDSKQLEPLLIEESLIKFGDYVVYVDESGDHSLESIDPQYPVFVLAFAIFHKRHYAEKIVPAIEKLKFNYFGHDLIVLHEHEIRKKKNAFTPLNNQQMNKSFLADLSQIMQRSNLILIACVIDKHLIQTSSLSVQDNNPYHLALGHCIEGLYDFLSEKNQLNYKTHILVERRGKKEDTALELEFHRLCSGENRKKITLPFEIVFVHKQANSTGLQLADLVARPFGIHYLRPTQANKAFSIMEQKLMCRGGRSNIGCDYQGYGLKVIPKK